MDSLPQYAAGLVIALVLVVLTSRLVFSPIKHYPGPLLGRLTNAYAGWHAITGDIHLVTYLDHLKYGPVVRQAPNRLVFNTLAAVQDIYLNPKVSKAWIYKNARFRNSPSVFTELDKDEHRRRRKAVGQATSDRFARQFEPIMMSQVDIFLGLILRSSQKGETVEMTERCNFLAMDVIGLLAFGVSLKTQTEETLRIIPKAFGALNPRVYLFMNWPKTHWIDPGVQWLVKERIERFRRILSGIMSQRMALPQDAMHDLYSFVASDDKIAQVQQEGIRKSEIWGEAGIFMNAGGTTTATAMCTVFYYLSRNPFAYARLASEIRSSFSLGSDIRHGQRLTSCKYLRAVIDESLRICPSTPGVMWREKDPKSAEPLIVDGHLIPAGTLVGVGLYSLMHNSDYFQEPFRFRPERWLEEEGDGSGDHEARAKMRRAFLPFMLGDRGCAGKAIAYLEMSLTVAKTLWYFDFEAAPGKEGDVGSGRVGAAKGRDRPDEYQLHDRFMAEHQGPNLVFRPRDNQSVELLEVLQTVEPAE